AIPLPEAFSLDRAYPNPFNPTTTLSFALPIDSEVSLSIYNLQGREVVSLVNGNMDAGYHSVVWNADRFGSGVYFVKMVAGEFVNTQKLMLVK
ncbi:MAG TPA: T9SS type A sorting domain-containing protein, partial [Candidatus Marinimicrobia bacterium]|nr:T9SS type A sorting domain-containing protein [Candidatus Neomarinimicrobiota bacterium]